MRLPPLRSLPRVHRALLVAVVVALGSTAPRHVADAQLALPGTHVRVLLARAGTVEMVAEGAHRGLVDGVSHFSTSLPLSWPLAAVDGRLLVDGVPVGTSLQIAMDEGLLALDGRRYRGSLRFTPVGDELEIVHILAIGHYPRG